MVYTYTIVDFQDILEKYKEWPNHHLVKGRCVRLIGNKPALVLMVDSLVDKHEIEKAVNRLDVEILVVVEIGVIATDSYKIEDYNKYKVQGD